MLPSIFRSKSGVEQPTSKTVSFRTDPQYRAVRRNLSWTSLAAILFTFSKPSTNPREFSFSLLGIESTYDKFWFSAALLLAILFLVAKFHFENRRIFVALNSEAAIRPFLNDGTSNDYSSDTLSRGISDTLDRARSAIETAVLDLEKSATQIPAIRASVSRMDSATSSTDWGMAFSPATSSLDDAIATLRAITDGPMVPNIGDFEATRITNAVESLHRTRDQIISLQNDFRAKLEGRETWDRFSNELLNYNLTLKSVSLEFTKSTEQVKTTKNDLESVMNRYHKMSQSIRKEEKFVHAFFDQIAPYSLAAFGAIGCAHWIYSTV